VSEIKSLQEGDYDAFVTLMANAYPAFKMTSEEERERRKQRLGAQTAEPTNHLLGLFREGRLIGGMIMYDFTMQLLSARAPVGGVGSIAVDLLRKKEKVAYELVLFFLRHYRARGAPLTTLYPFRPDFYRQMGFGAGTQMSQYHVLPADLPRGSKEHIVFLRAEEKELLRDCYNRVLARTHGLMEKSDSELNGLFNNVANRIVAYKRDDRVLGYLVFSFKPGEQANFLINDLVVRELFYETREALAELFSFLHTQADQVRRVIFNTQDEDFYHALRDPRNETGNLLPDVYHESNTQGVGIMYRVIDTAGLFGLLRDHDFGGQDCKLKLMIRDSFFPENDGATVVSFTRGRPSISDTSDDYDVEVGLDVADFSSLVMGAVRFASLYSYGLAEISDPRAIVTIDRLFRTERKPICTTPF
jgi:predicted acetyltransferase